MNSNKDAIPNGPEKATDAGRFELRLGDLKGQWLDFCAARGVNPSVAIKAAIVRLMKAAPAAAAPAAPPKIFGVEPDSDKDPKAPIWVLLTLSEREAADQRARLEGFASTNRWVAATVRAALTNKPEFGQHEITALQQSNLQLLAIGRNLNQIAKRLNAEKDESVIQGYDRELVENLAGAVRLHVKKVGDALRASIYRWRIK